MSQDFKIGYLMGNGAAINVAIGFIPDYISITNLTDGDVIWTGALVNVYTFTSGGTTEIKAGDKLVGATSGATFKVREVLTLSSGTWAGGDAAGSLIGDVDEATGTITSGENVYVSGGSSTNDATLTAAFPKQYTTSIDTEVANEATNVITAYVGSSTAGKGFTIASGIAEEAKVLQYVALRGG